MSRTPTHLHRTNYTSTAPTPGFRGASGTGTLRPDHRPSPRLDRGGDPRRQTQGCDNRIAQHNAPVSQNRPISEASHTRAALNGALQAPETSFRSSGRRAEGDPGQEGPPDLTQATQGEAGELRGQSPVDRSRCEARSNPAGTPQHGTACAYSRYKCRCPDALEAERLYRKRKREGRLPPYLVATTGTRRRIQALACIGYSPAKIAAGFCTGMQLKTIRANKVQQVTRTIAVHVAQFYAQHSERPLPMTSYTSQVRNIAKRNGWAPPIAWDYDTIDNPNAEPQLNVPDTDAIDEVELLLLLAGRLRGERTPRRARLNEAAVQILDARGWTAPEIAARLEISERGVVRVRARIGISHVAPPTQAELNPGIARANRRTNQAEAPHSTAHERHHEAA